MSRSSQVDAESGKEPDTDSAEKSQLAGGEEVAPRELAPASGDTPIWEAASRDQAAADGSRVAPSNTPCDGQLLDRLQAGDEEAAAEVFHRYVERLTALARSRLSQRLAARLDADDVVMSAYRSFFVRAREGAFALGAGGDLWRLLVEITLHKLYRQAAHHSAKKRSVAREASQPDGRPQRVAAPEPTADLAVAAAEELGLAMRELSANARAALELRLQGHDLNEIARQLRCSERTVRRWLDDVKATLRKQFPHAESHQRVTLGDKPHDARPKRKRSPARSSLPHCAAARLRFADFLLKRQLGAGTTGKVYLATDTQRGVEVAVKFLRKRYLRHADVRGRFVAEAHLMARLEHPGIVHVHGIGPTPNGGYFIVLDYLPGGDLEARRRTSAITLKELQRWLVVAANAVQHAHECGIIHCDLKPSNLLLTATGEVAVTDFGFARLLAPNASRAGEIAGTPAFMAPEQLDPAWGAVGPHTDVYGLGAVLYTLLTGRPPHVGSPHEILAGVAAGTPIQERESGGSPLAAVLLATAQRCLASRPSDRFSTADDVARALVGGA